ncbi:TPA: hypothetical protein I7286_18945 [Vibrio parahaemolyticus]|nr:hypothetical protein [Vibrio parahaemolyticus]
MSIELVKEQVKVFLESSEPEVLAIKGRWGVGKTFGWNKYLKEFKDNTALSSYSYVSLFGVNSLNELKQAVFENTIDTKIIGEKPNLETFKANYQSIAKKFGRKSTGVLQGVKIPFVSNYVEGIEGLFSSLSYLSLNQTIICFDDLERHGKDLDIKDFLGVVSYFKEQKDCKVVILLNEDSGSASLKEYATYKEKVIDKQLHFNPTAQECFDLAIKVQEQYEHLRECCIKLDIKNIRVLKKIERHIQDLLTLTLDYHHKLKYQVVHSVVVFSWCYYCSGGDDTVPPFNFLKQTGLRKKSVSADESKVNEWNNRLSNYGYQLTDELDIVIAESIEQGFVDKAKWSALCNARQSDLEAMERNEACTKAWDLFHASFDNNAEIVIEEMEKGLKTAFRDISTYQYSQGINLIRELGDHKKADELTEFYIEQMKDRPNIFNMDNHPFGIVGEEFKSKLQEAYHDLKQDDTPMVILERWRGQNSWSSDDAEILGKLSKNQLKEMFKGFKDKDLTDYIRVCLRLGNSSPELLKNTREALKEIGDESAINKHRLSKFSL